MGRTNSGFIYDAEAHAMHKRDRELIPTRLVVAMFSLAVLTVILVAIAVLTDRPLVGTPPPSEVMKTHTLTLTGDGNAMQGVEGNAPVTVTEYADGRIELHDPASGWTTQVSSFGAGNLNVWRALLAQS